MTAVGKQWERQIYVQEIREDGEDEGEREKSGKWKSSPRGQMTSHPLLKMIDMREYGKITRHTHTGIVSTFLLLLEMVD